MSRTQQSTRTTAVAHPKNTMRIRASSAIANLTGSSLGIALGFYIAQRSVILLIPSNEQLLSLADTSCWVAIRSSGLLTALLLIVELFRPHVAQNVGQALIRPIVPIEALFHRRASLTPGNGPRLG